MNAFAATLEQLPPPVARYLRMALPGGPLAWRAVRLLQQGEMRLQQGGGRWLPFRARQRLASAPPEFQWQARIRLAPLLWARVMDEYLDGLGRLQARLWGVIPLASAENDAHLDEAELLRYLAEAVWFPQALLPSERLQWQATGPDSALAILRDGVTQARLTFHFNRAGEIVRGEALRPALQGSRYVSRGWTTRYHDWQSHHGMRVPMAGSAAWHLPAGEWAYWRGRITSLAGE